MSQVAFITRVLSRAGCSYNEPILARCLYRYGHLALRAYDNYTYAHDENALDRFNKYFEEFEYCYNRLNNDGYCFI